MGNFSKFTLSSRDIALGIVHAFSLFSLSFMFGIFCCFVFISRSSWGFSYKKFILYHWASDSLLGYLELPGIGSQFSHYQQPYDKLSKLVNV